MEGNSKHEKPEKNSEVLNVDHFIDVVKNQRNQYDTLFSLKLWRPSPVLYPENTKHITEQILKSPRVKDVIGKISANNGKDEMQIQNELITILKEMGHNFQLSTVRVLAWFLAKLLRQLYQGLLINKDGIAKLKKTMNDGPVLILPTHRSYADFLLISFLCFSLNIPMPVIAAGMDFKGMQVLNSLLQGAGAFYIRRSFGQDHLYWTAVSEYIQYHMKHFQAPMEFFLEGTRSRVGKSLTPKSGLLSMALEPYLKGEIPDIKICTISISYERTLEENLYAYEILGVPKPKESTLGFLGAVDKLRGEKFGRIYVNIGDPISVADRLPRRPTPDWNAPSFRFETAEDTKKSIQVLAKDLVCQQQREVITPMSSLLLLALSVKELQMEQLVQQVIALNSCLSTFATPCMIPGDVGATIEECLDIHQLKIVRDEQGRYCYPSIEQLNPDLQSWAANRLVLQQYTNQVLGPLINVAVFAYLKEVDSSLDDIIVEMDFFARYFSEEFVLLRPCDEKDLSMFNSVDKGTLEILSRLIQPYVEVMYIIVNILDMGILTSKEIVLCYKRIAACVLRDRISSLGEILAVDKVSRHLFNLSANGNLNRSKSSQGEITFQVVDVTSIICRLEKYVSKPFSDLLKTQRDTFVSLQSQL